MAFVDSPCLHQRAPALLHSGPVSSVRNSRSRPAGRRSQLHVSAVAEVNHIVQDTPAQTRRMVEVTALLEWTAASFSCWWLHLVLS